jgi:hypothetical protein
VTSQEPKSPTSAARDIPDTEVIAVSAPSPVFVDSTGRRRRVLRRLAYAFGAVCMLYGGLISVSLAGGPVSSSAILPLPATADRPVTAATVPPQPIPEPAVKAPPAARLLADTAPRRVRTPERAAAPRVAAATTRPVRPTPTRTSTPSRTPESTDTPTVAVSSTPTTRPSTTPTPTEAAPPDAPPPAPPGFAGGSGGGSGTPIDDEFSDPDRTPSQTPPSPEEDA